MKKSNYTLRDNDKALLKIISKARKENKNLIILKKRGKHEL